MDTWRTCEQTGDAIVDYEDDDSGETLPIRVPWEHRATMLGWKRGQARAKWKDPLTSEERHGLVISEGPYGVLARDESAVTHALPHGTYTPVAETRLAKAGKFELHEGGAGGGGNAAPAKKKYPPIPPGGRWISVGHEGSKHAILIVPAGDGTHRVIGGVGGAMNHLRLKDVKSEDEMKEATKRKEKAKRDADREKQQGMSAQERKAEKEAKQAKKERMHAAERTVIETVREKVGGIDKDLTDEDLEGLPDKARERLLNQHHRKQLAQAQRLRKDLGRKLSAERMEQIEDEVAVEATIRESPDLWEEAQAAGQRELALIAEEDEARRLTRNPSATRADSEQRAAAAARTAQAALATVDRDAASKTLKELGGRADAVGALPGSRGETASEEQRRRAAENIDNALILADAAAGRAPSADPVRAGIEFSVITDALKAAGVTGDLDNGDVRAALANEAAIQLQRAQLAQLKAKKFEALEKAGEAEKAVKMLAIADVNRGLSAQVRDAAKKLGLREDSKTPLKQAEIAEIMDVLGSFDALRDAKKDLESVEKEVEKKVPEHDASRRAFNLVTSEPPAHVIENVEEQVRRELAQRILGMSDEHSPDHVKAVADGHYGKLADIDLSVSNQSHLDRCVVDAVGLKNAGILLRHALESEGHDADTMHNALVGHHVREQVKLTAEAIRQAEAIIPNLEETCQEVGDFAHAAHRLDAAGADIAAAQRAVGTALGQMECSATLAQSFTGKQPEHLSIDLKDRGQGTIASHLTWLASVGLQPGDYEIDTENKEIRIPKESWKKLIHTEPREVVDQRKLAHAIKRGEHDEQNWLPPGLVSRSSTSFTDPPKDAPRYHTALDLNADDIHTALADHVGSRLADGERPADVATDLLSPAVAGKSADPEAFSDMVREFFPLTTEGDQKQLAENAKIARERGALADEYKAAQAAGDIAKGSELAARIAAMPKEQAVEQKRDVHFADHYRKLTEQYLQRHHPGASTLHAASLYHGAEEKDVREAVFRALAKNPHHAAAFVPLGQLEPKHEKALKDYFYRRAGIADTHDYSKEFAERHAQLVTDIGKRTSGRDELAGQGGMFGGMFAEAPKKVELSKDTVGTLHPTEAKALAYEYPREGKALFAQAMGERPAEPTTPPKLSEDVQRAIGAVREKNPAMTAAQAAAAAGKHLGRERALKSLGIEPEALQERDPITGEPTAKARALTAQVFGKAQELEERGIDPREVQRSYGHLIHDAEHAEFAAYTKKHETPWASFIDMHGDRGNAIQALQEELKGEFAKEFAPTYSQVTGKTVQTAISEVPNADLHQQALASPMRRAELAAKKREEVRAAQKRAGAGEIDLATGKGQGGRYVAGSALAAYRAAKEAERGTAQRQGGLFGSAPPAPGKLAETTTKREPGPGERMALGQQAEKEIAALVGGNIGKNLNLDKPVDLIRGASMDGRRIHLQRMLKMIDGNGGRLFAAAGTGAGKTILSIGNYTQAEAKKKATHGLFLTPVAVQQQFGEEMLNFTEPGKYRFDTGAKKSHAERIAMLQDKSVHMRVLTHAAATKTVLRMTADHHNIAPEAMLERLRAMPDHERAQTIRDVLDAHGIPKHATYVDEAHGLTTRKGERESAQSIILGALSHPVNSDNALFGSATPNKNDTSEIYSQARLTDPDQFADAYRFTQNHGANSVGAPDAVRRTLDHRVYSTKIPPDGVERIDTANPEIGPDGKKTPGGPIALHPEHQKKVDAVRGAYEKARTAFRDGGVDVESTKLLSPGRFKHAAESEHEAIARKLAPSLGIVKERAIRRALQLEPLATNNKLRRMVDIVQHDVAAGKPHIIFTDSAEEARHVHRTLLEQGIATGLYDGGLRTNDRESFRRDFAQGKLKAAVMTAAGEAGINMQAGKAVSHYDTPMTAKSYSQRNGRAFRQGQADDVDTHLWTWNDDFDTAAVRRMQDKSRLAEVFESPLGPADERGFAADYAAALAKKHQGFDLDRMPLAAK